MRVGQVLIISRTDSDLQAASASVLGGSWWPEAARGGNRDGRLQQACWQRLVGTNMNMPMMVHVDVFVDLRRQQLSIS